jgi:hypothetical protein
MKSQKPTRLKFALHDHSHTGTWLTEVNRFHKLAKSQLIKCEIFAEQVNNAWTKPLDQPIKGDEISENQGCLVDQRDLASDMTRIFAAIAIEAFINFYGVVRMGEAEYNAHYERLGLVPKLQQLLLLCDSLSVSDKDLVIKALDKVAQSRNAIVHPKTREISPENRGHHRYSTAVPQTARSAIEEMDIFFKEFVVLVPKAKHLVP